jgi:hypothetical protein
MLHKSSKLSIRNTRYYIPNSFYQYIKRKKWAFTFVIKTIGGAQYGATLVHAQLHRGIYLHNFGRPTLIA